MNGIASWLAAQPECEVMLAMDRSPEDFSIGNIERVLLKKADRRLAREGLAERMAAFMQKAEKTHYSLRSLSSRKGEPDVVMTYSSDGGAFGLKELFPNAFIVNYVVSMEPFSRHEARAVGLLQAMQCADSDMNFAFGEAARKRLPRPFWRRTGLAPLAVDTGWFAPLAESGKTDGDKKLLVFWLKDCDPGGFGFWLNGITRFLLAREEMAALVLAPNTGVVRLAEQRLAALPASLADRLTLKCYPARNWRRDMWRRASLFVSPFRSLNLDMLEAMSCGCPPVTACRARGLQAGFNCLGFSGKNLFAAIEGFLANPEELAGAGLAAREYALSCHAVERVVPGHIREVLAARDNWLGSRA